MPPRARGCNMLIIHVIRSAYIMHTICEKLSTVAKKIRKTSKYCIKFPQNRPQKHTPSPYGKSGKIVGGWIATQRPPLPREVEVMRTALTG